VTGTRHMVIQQVATTEAAAATAPTVTAAGKWLGLKTVRDEAIRSRHQCRCGFNGTPLSSVKFRHAFDLPVPSSLQQAFDMPLQSDAAVDVDSS